MIHSVWHTVTTPTGVQRASFILWAAFVVFFTLGQHPAVAQSARELASRIGQLEQEIHSLRGPPGNASADMTLETAAGAQLRVLKLEQLLEQLTGQVEEAHFRVGQMSTEIRQLSDDVNYRLAILEQALGVSGAVTSEPGSGLQPRPLAQTTATPSSANVLPAAGQAPLSQPVSSQPRRSLPRRDAAAQVAAGPPQSVTPAGQMVLRTDGQGEVLPADPNETLAPSPATGAVAPAPQAAPNPAAVSSNQLSALPPTTRVSLPDGTPKEQYEYAFNFLTRNDFASAEVALRAFMTSNPEDALASNAQYWLGETYYVRGDYKQAAIEFMSGYQKYPRSNKGPDNLLKLGMSMASLGQIQGACTALNRIAKDYAEAPGQIRRAAATQRADLKCK